MEGAQVWSHGEILCAGETHGDKGTLRFAKGAAVEDPAGLFNPSLAGLFNSSLEDNARRAIHIHEGDKIDEFVF